MVGNLHTYSATVTWTGNRGSGTTGYRDYDRAVRVEADGKPRLDLSADPTFRGDRTKWNPEELLLIALSQCHLLSYLHVAVRNRVVVVDYADTPHGEMATEGIGGRFIGVVLRPVVTITDPAQADLAVRLHHDAAQACFIGASVNFPVTHEPRVVIK